MNLKHLETFYHFCRLTTMSRTADHLHVTQSAVSQQLSNFQAECGARLFYRDANEYKLTGLGEAMFLLAKRIFSRVEQIEGLLEKERKPGTERLRIGTTKTYARTIMPELIARFQEQHPLIHVRLSEGNSAELIKRVFSSREDLVVVARTKYDSSLRAIPFAKCEFVLVGRPDHPLAIKAPVSITALSDESMIIRERGSGSRTAILETLQRFGVTPSVLVESESFSFIMAYIERRMGLSFMLSHEIEDEVAGGALKQISLLEGNISFDSDIVARRNEPLSLPSRYFLKIAEKYRLGDPPASRSGRR